MKNIPEWVLYILGGVGIVIMFFLFRLVVFYWINIKNFFRRLWNRNLMAVSNIKTPDKIRNGSSNEGPKTDKSKSNGGMKAYAILAYVFTILMIALIIRWILNTDFGAGFESVVEFLKTNWFWILLLINLGFLIWGLISKGISEVWNFIKKYAWPIGILSALVIGGLLLFNWIRGSEKPKVAQTEYGKLPMFQKPVIQSYERLGIGTFQFVAGVPYEFNRNKNCLSLTDPNLTFCGVIKIIPKDPQLMPKIRMQSESTPSVYIEGVLNQSGDLVMGASNDDRSVDGKYLLIPTESFTGTVLLQ